MIFKTTFTKLNEVYPLTNIKNNPAQLSNWEHKSYKDSVYIQINNLDDNDKSEELEFEIITIPNTANVEQEIISSLN
jgi:hypothetical protein